MNANVEDSVQHSVVSPFVVFLFVSTILPADQFEVNAEAPARIAAEVGLNAKTIAYLNRLPGEAPAWILQTSKESLLAIGNNVEGLSHRCMGSSPWK